MSEECSSVPDESARAEHGRAGRGDAEYASRTIEVVTASEERDGALALDSDPLTYRFDDPYWDDAFGTLYDPAMRVCSIFGC
jgi:hypothetical protein